jgi:hypothetical protein
MVAPLNVFQNWPSTPPDSAKMNFHGSFILESIAIGTDDDGNVTTAPVVVQADTTVSDGSNLKSHTAKALESLERAVAEHGQRVPDGTPSFPHDAKIVPPDTWRDCYYADCRAREPKVTKPSASSSDGPFAS